MPFASRPRTRPRALVRGFWAAFAACSGGDPAITPPDSGTDGPVGAVDAGDTRPTLLAVDFTIVGCPDLDPVTPKCRGQAPLSVSFVPIFSGNVTRFLWDFGDLTESSETFPDHTYALPGIYDVSVTGLPSLATKTHPGFVEVLANPLGNPCDVDRQCADSLSCLCGLNAQCPAAFPRGTCTQPCPTGVCAASAVCADLTGGAMQPPADGSAGLWRTRTCLRACTADTECPAGQRCRSVPTAAAPGTWAKACFYGFPGSLGAACRDGNGKPQNDLCLSGLCADLGAQGRCSHDCTTTPCPAGSHCAAFGDGRRLCIEACTPENLCQEDPLVGCMVPGRPGALGFTVADAPAGLLYCAPRACNTDVDCQPAGVCLGPLGQGHCQRPLAP